MHTHIWLFLGSLLCSTDKLVILWVNTTLFYWYSFIIFLILIGKTSHINFTYQNCLDCSYLFVLLIHFILPSCSQNCMMALSMRNQKNFLYKCMVYRLFEFFLVIFVFVLYLLLNFRILCFDLSFWCRNYKYHCQYVEIQWICIYLRRRQWHPTPVLLPGKSHGWRSLVGCSPWGREESDRTERLHFHFSLSCVGEGNGNPLQCSCLENPRDWGAWWAAVYGVAQSRTRLKRLSSSSIYLFCIFLSYWTHNEPVVGIFFFFNF